MSTTKDFIICPQITAAHLFHTNGSSFPSARQSPKLTAAVSEHGRSVRRIPEGLFMLCKMTTGHILATRLWLQLVNQAFGTSAHVKQLVSE